jgi:hypothetical protein
MTSAIRILPQFLCALLWITWWKHRAAPMRRALPAVGRKLPSVEGSAKKLEKTIRCTFSLASFPASARDATGVAMAGKHCAKESAPDRIWFPPLRCRLFADSPRPSVVPPPTLPAGAARGIYRIPFNIPCKNNNLYIKPDFGTVPAPSGFEEMSQPSISRLNTL